MKSTCKRVVLLLFIIAVGVGIYYGYAFVRAWKLFAAEDEIAHTYYPVVEAINQYVEEYEQPPTQLDDLIPSMLSTIPECGVVDSVEYRVQSDGKAWRLVLHSDVCGSPRMYCWQSDNRYTSEEKQHVLGQYHGQWTVMKNTKASRRDSRYTENR